MTGTALDTVGSVFNKPFSSKDNSAIKQHLQNVYGCLTLGMLSATAGAYLQLTHAPFQSITMTLLCSAGAFGSVLYVKYTKNQAGGDRTRLGAFIGFTLCVGVGLGPLLNMVVRPAIILTAFMLTTVLFVSFTLAAIFAREEQWILVGGSLVAILSTLVTLSLAVLLFGSELLLDVSLLLWLLIECGLIMYVVYVTHLILKKVKAGDEDHLSHCFDLFKDLIEVLRYLLGVLLIIQTRFKPDRRGRRR